MRTSWSAVPSSRRVFLHQAGAAGTLLFGFPRGAAADRREQAIDGFYFGRIAFENVVIGLAVKSRQVEVLVTDAEPGGNAEWFKGPLKNGRINLQSSSRRARLNAAFDPVDKICLGTIDLPNGATRAMAAGLAGEGADLYRLRVRQGTYQGHSTQGHRLEARQEGSYLVGLITERHGAEIPFQVMDLSEAFRYSIRSGEPDEYTVIVSRNGTLHYGRSGAVRAGRPGQNLVAYDVQPSARPTPGFFFGKVAFERDVIGVKLDPPDELGNRQVRAYMSDSEPGGDLQWFRGESTENVVDLVSVTGDGRLLAVLEDDLVSGELFLPGGRQRRFFALPAGEGAGIYDVTVDDQGRLFGTSEEGGTLLGESDGLFVHLTIISADGEVFESHPNDLTRALDYPLLGNEPDTYVAIVAPRGRFVFGRSGNVRTGRSGNNIIGLDKAC